jgi:hypothetical protein
MQSQSVEQRADARRTKRAIHRPAAGRRALGIAR